MEQSVRWSLKVSRETDEALRAYLGQRGGRKGDLSRFIEEAVRNRLAAAVRPRKKGKGSPRASERAAFADTLAEIRERTRALTRARFEKFAAEALAYARKRR